MQADKNTCRQTKKSLHVADKIYIQIHKKRFHMQADKKGFTYNQSKIHTSRQEKPLMQADIDNSIQAY